MERETEKQSQRTHRNWCCRVLISPCALIMGCVLVITIVHWVPLRACWVPPSHAPHSLAIAPHVLPPCVCLVARPFAYRMHIVTIIRHLLLLCAWDYLFRSNTATMRSVCVVAKHLLSPAYNTHALVPNTCALSSHIWCHQRQLLMLAWRHASVFDQCWCCWLQVGVTESPSVGRSNTAIACTCQYYNTLQARGSLCCFSTSHGITLKLFETFSTRKLALCWTFRNRNIHIHTIPATSNWINSTSSLFSTKTLGKKSRTMNCIWCSLDVSVGILTLLCKDMHRIFSKYDSPGNDYGVWGTKQKLYALSITSRHSSSRAICLENH